MIKEFNNVDMSARNSFGVRQCAARLLEFEDVGDLVHIFSVEKPEKWYVISGGNNVLLTQDYEGVILTPAARWFEVVGEDDASLTVDVAAGVEWDDFVEWCVERDLWGAENLSLIPGKVGAAPVQNIGAYGAEAKDVIESVEMFDTETLKTVRLHRDYCAFGYRDSVFKGVLKGRVVILSVRFRLSKVASPNIEYGDVKAKIELFGGVSLRNIRRAVCEIRSAKLPDKAVMGNAGSFFKNPIVECGVADSLKAQYADMPMYGCAEAGCVKIPAGWLIEKAGLKGYKSGHVGVHSRQALVLVNLGGATGSDVLSLARYVQQSVSQKFGVKIDTEVNIL